MNKYLKLLIVFSMLLNLTACGVGSYLMEKGSSVVSAISPKGISLDWNSVIFVASENANLNSPTKVDIVLASDEATLALITNLTATKWFASRSDLEKTFPYALSYQSIEIVPGQRLVLSPEVFRPGRVAGVMIFADYLIAGENRMRIDQLKGDILVQLAERSFFVSNQLNNK